MQITVNKNESEKVAVAFTFSRELTESELDMIRENSADYVFNYGLRQSLSDSVASATTRAEAEASFAKRLEKLMDGTMSERDGGMSPLEREMLNIAEARFMKVPADKRKAKIAEVKKTVGGKTDTKAVKAILRAIIKAYRDEIAAEAEERLAQIDEVSVDLNEII